MNENYLQIIASSKILWLGIFSFLYGRGGMWNKAWRRWGGSFFLTLGICLFSYLTKTFSWWFLLYFPLLSLSLHIGYGGDTLADKLIKRGRYGAALGCAALPIALVTGQWLLFGFHLGLCIFVSVLLGVFNPVDARHEETLIASLSGLLPLFMVA